jgi:hypothetical protein
MFRLYFSLFLLSITIWLWRYAILEIGKKRTLSKAGSQRGSPIARAVCKVMRFHHYLTRTAAANWQGLKDSSFFTANSIRARSAWM